LSYHADRVTVLIGGIAVLVNLDLWDVTFLAVNR
jgi:hypothetical protein